jgi:hypothetical protein
MMRYLAALIVFCVSACGTTAPSTSPLEPPEAEIPSIESLTTEWGCGRGFQVSNADQTVSLRIAPRGEGQPDQRVTLPHPDWRAELVQGADLHANWCDDVMEPGEPTPVESSRLEVVKGDLRIVGELPEDTGGGGGMAVTLEASDLVLELPDGTEVPFGSITITNSNWGLLAG